MIAKIIVHAQTREAAARKLEAACGRVEAWPVKTNAGFLARCARHPDFVAGRIDTGFIDGHLEVLVEAPDAPEGVLQSAARLFLSDLGAFAAVELTSPWSPGAGAFGFRLNAAPVGVAYLAHVSGTVRIELDRNSTAPSRGYARTADGIVVFHCGDAYSFTTPDPGGEAADAPSSGDLISPMPGQIVLVSADVGAYVAKGHAIVTLEAMKMEYSLTAPFAGMLTALSVKLGDQVAEGDILARIEESD